MPGASISHWSGVTSTLCSAISAHMSELLMLSSLSGGETQVLSSVRNLTSTAGREAESGPELTVFLCLDPEANLLLLNRNPVKVL